jgi:NAD(P)-dependent dehydrogenase (short-subunit alcohol dehydrogenase family)
MIHGNSPLLSPAVQRELTSPSSALSRYLHRIRLSLTKPRHGDALAPRSVRENNAPRPNKIAVAPQSGESAMDLGLQGKRAIVTGGSRGIGKAIARELAREGVDVAIVARNKTDLEATARELAAETNRRILPLAADVTSKEQVDRMVAEAAEQLGGLHILVNSGSPPGGSATATGPIDTVVDEDLLQDFNVKYVGALRCSRAAIPFMKTEGWGRIINISGTNARNPGNLSGGARNASLVHMTKTLAVQLGRHGITVNCIHPGITRTERTPRLLAARASELGISPEEVERQDFAPDSPRGNAICRMVDASEVAFVAAFLVSEKASAISGELVVATGGAGRAVYY